MCSAATDIGQFGRKLREDEMYSPEETVWEFVGILAQSYLVHAIRLLSFCPRSRFCEPVFDSSLMRFHPNGIALCFRKIGIVVFKPRDSPMVSISSLVFCIT